jgi:uncharacterized protein YqeY
MLKASIQNAEKVKGSSLSDEEFSAVASREAKIRRGSLQEFEGAGRADLAENEAYALSVLADYLPAQLSEDDLRIIVERAIAQLEDDVLANPGAATGFVMRAVMPEVRGQADGTALRRLVEEALSQQSAST